MAISKPGKYSKNDLSSNWIFSIPGGPKLSTLKPPSCNPQLKSLRVNGPKESIEVRNYWTFLALGAVFTYKKL